MKKESLPSNRSFAAVFFIVFLLLAIMTWKKNGLLYPVYLVLAVVTGIIGLFRPDWLMPFNRAWMTFAGLLHRVMNPVVLALLFFGIITPFSFVLRMFRKDPLLRSFDPTIKSYWIKRDPPGPDKNSMSNQF